MSTSLDSLIHDLEHFASYPADQRADAGQRAAWLEHANSNDVDRLIDALLELDYESTNAPTESFL